MVFHCRTAIVWQHLLYRLSQSLHNGHSYLLHQLLHRRPNHSYPARWKYLKQLPPPSSPYYRIRKYLSLSGHCWYLTVLLFVEHYKFAPNQELTNEFHLYHAASERYHREHSTVNSRHYRRNGCHNEHC